MEFSETELNEILNIFKYEGLEIVDTDVGWTLRGGNAAVENSSIHMV